MRKETIEAKSRQGEETKIVGTGEINVYETLDEARADLTDQRVLDYVNRQHKINEMNRIRNAATAGPSVPKVLRDRLMALPEDKRAEVCAALGIEITDLA